ncbi:AMP-binding protein [Sphingomonas solaris]|uniref:AMP-binding protein n=1 Tax=Alterirhizorhabdus solaris TaxID=2529389 RepID=A0A558RA48_9SPHN|nr:AMP-binding protein [Sphingomonas solaris]TVV76263.1 AMP-binding protein [Sphingomonas solaris]
MSLRRSRDLLLALRDDYAAARAAFRWPDLDAFNWAIDWFDGELAQGDTAGATALRIVGEHAATRTFADLSERSNRVANGLRALGLRPGDRLLLMLGNRAELWETMLAAMKLGVVTIPASTLLTAGDIAARIEQAGVRAWIAEADLAATLAVPGVGLLKIAVDEAPPGWSRFDDLLAGAASFTPAAPGRASDPALLYFTSGTTAKPKLVMHSHYSYGVGSLSTMYWLGLRPGDVHLNVSSPGWAKHAWSCLFAPWNAGATVFVANLGRFDAPALLDAIADNGVTSLCAPPTAWRMMIQEDLTQWRTLLASVCGAGEPLNPEVIATVQRAWGLTIRDGFGQTETTAQIANSPGQPVRPGSMGRPLPGYDIALLDDDGNETDEGEIAIRLEPRPAGLMIGYQDEGGLRRLEGDYYRTGDVATRDADGWMTYVGRADDVFKAADYRISPFELESALIEHAAVAEAAVVPAPDPVRLAVPKAYIALAPGHAPDRETARAILAHVRVALAPYKRVRRIEFFELPKTISGKIRRIELRRREIEHARTGTRAEGEHREEDFPELRTT